MKTLNYYFKMAFIAAFLCTNLVACDKDDPENEGIITGAKKLVEMKITTDEETTTLQFTYDDKNRLVKSNTFISGQGYTDSWTDDYTWGENVILHPYYKYTIENGLVKHEEMTIYDSYSYNYTYNPSKFLTERYGGAQEETISLTWNGNKLTNVTTTYYNETVAYTITNKGTCKGYNPIIISLADIPAEEGYSIFFAHPELIGLRTNQLVSEANYTTSYYNIKGYYSYTFSDDYIESCTIKDKNGTPAEVITFKWQ